MKRRAFITLIGGAAAVWPFAARAQPGDRVKRIGWLVPYVGDGRDSTIRRTFDQEMAKLGWTDGRYPHVDGRAGAGDDTRLRTHAAALVAQACDVIVVNGTQATAIVQRETSTIPIVFVNVADPVASGLVVNMARPAGNT